MKDVKLRELILEPLADHAELVVLHTGTRVDHRIVLDDEVFYALAREVMPNMDDFSLRTQASFRIMRIHVTKRSCAL